MYRVADIKHILREKDYIPVVRKAGDGVVITMPHPRLTRPQVPRITEAYSIRRTPEEVEAGALGSGLYYNSSLSPDEKFMSLGEHAIRLFLMADIVSRCRRVPISVELVSYLDEAGKEHPAIECIVDPPSTEEERTKEGFLRRLFLEARDEGFPAEFETVAMNHQVYDGYRLVKAFFEA